MKKEQEYIEVTSSELQDIMNYMEGWNHHTDVAILSLYGKITDRETIQALQNILLTIEKNHSKRGYILFEEQFVRDCIDKLGAERVKQITIPVKYWTIYKNSELDFI